MTECIALLRGVNVGRAKRIAMADLRDLVEGLGHSNARTLLNSGNLVFRAAQPNAASIASALEAAIAGRFGFAVPVIVLTSAELDAIVSANPLSQATRDASRFLVAFVAKTTVLAKAKALLDQSWVPEQLALGRREAYLWCAKGIAVSGLMQAFDLATGKAATARNWATVLKLQAAARSGAP